MTVAHLPLGRYQNTTYWQAEAPAAITIHVFLRCAASTYVHGAYDFQGRALVCFAVSKVPVRRRAAGFVEPNAR